MVTSGRSRQSSRCAIVAGRAASASASAASENDIGNAVRGDGDPADRALRVDRAEPLDDARRGQAEAALAQHFERDEIAVDGAAVMPWGMKISRGAPRFSTGRARPAPFSSAR